MPFLFHQNMRTFGGANAARNGAYLNAFTAINQQIGLAGPLSVMGFTEIVNNGAALGALGPLANALSPGAGGILVACGITALANGPEFVGIATANGLAVLSVGRILLQAVQGGIQLISDVSPAVPPPALWAANLPPQATPDYRGVVYVVVAAGGTSVAVGYLHNLYTFQDQRALVMGQIPNMMQIMASNPAMGPGGHVYLGGDFNVAPQNRGTNRTGIAYQYSAAAPPNTLYQGATPGGTTWAGNLYDYWYTDMNPAGPPPAPPFIIPVPAATGITMDHNLMSDHCAIVLQIA